MKNEELIYVIVFYNFASFIKASRNQLQICIGHRMGLYIYQMNTLSYKALSHVQKKSNFYQWEKQRTYNFEKKYQCPAGLQFYKYGLNCFNTYYNQCKFNFLVKSNVVKLETSCTLILPPTEIDTLALNDNWWPNFYCCCWQLSFSYFATSLLEE